MDNECIANWLKSIKEKYIHGGDEALDSTRKLAIDLAIERLNKQQAEIDRLKAEQTKKGHWIIDEYEYLDCSCCGESYYTGCDSTKEAKHRLEIGDVYKFCPYCGARMDGDHE